MVGLVNTLTGWWRKDLRDAALYASSPNCLAGRDPSAINPALPPCRDVPMTVLGKAQQAVVHHLRFRDYTETRRFLTLRDPAGRIRTVGGLYENVWNSVGSGTQVSTKVWRNEIHEVQANGDYSSTRDYAREGRLDVAVTRWVAVGAVSTLLLGVLWGTRSKQGPAWER